MDNIVHAVFGQYRTAETRALFQYDYGQILLLELNDLPDKYEVHFSNQEKDSATVTQIGDKNGVAIPDSMLRTGDDVYAWVYLHTGEDDGETVYKITIPVNKRSKPTNLEPTPIQADAITQAIAALNIAVEEAEAAQNASEVARDAAEEALIATEEAAHNAAQARDEAVAADNTAVSAAETAIECRNDAQAAANRSDQNAEDAEAWATGKRGGVDVGSGDETWQNNAAYYADRAQLAATTAGYLDITMDDNGFLIFTRTDAVDVEFELVNGELIMEVV